LKNCSKTHFSKNVLREGLLAETRHIFLTIVL
jgi:hypothetical protein